MVASAANARTLVERALREWRCEESLVERAVVVVNELVANVVRHTRGDAVVEVRRVRDAVRIDVSDSSFASAHVIEGTDPRSDERGRGLVLVRELSTKWGVEHRSDGKTVWAEFRLAP